MTLLSGCTLPLSQCRPELRTFVAEPDELLHAYPPEPTLLRLPELLPRRPEAG